MSHVPPTNWRQAFEAELRALMERTDAPGVGVTVFTYDDVLLEEGYGARDVAKGLPITGDTIFGIASITKSFTAMAVQLLAEDGLLTLDDPISDYLPFTLWEGREPARVRHFLNHTSGLPPAPTMTWLRAASQSGDPVAEGATRAEALSTVGGGEDEVARLAAEVSTFEGMVRWHNANSELLAEPGQQFSYSNDCFSLMGGVVQRLTGIPFDEFVRRRILLPLGMTRTTFDLDEVLADPNHTSLYDRGLGGEVLYSPEWQTTGIMQGGGMLKSTLADLRTWARTLMAPERGGAEKLGISVERVREMAMGTTWAGVNSEYGLGLRRDDGYAADVTGTGLSIIGHGGSLKGVSSQMEWVPQLGIGVVVLSNLVGLPSSKMTTMAVNAYAGLPVTKSTYEPTPYGGSEAERAAVLSQMLGSYASGEPYGRFRLFQNDAGELRAAVGAPAVEWPALLVSPTEVALLTPEQLTPVAVLRRSDGSVWGVHQGARVLRRQQ